MTSRVRTILLILLVMTGLPCCSRVSASGNLVGVVVRDVTIEPVPMPVLVIVRILKNSSGPEQLLNGDDLGRFSITLPEGKFNVKIGLKKEGPFYAWPDAVSVVSRQTSVYAFTLPEDFK